MNRVALLLLLVSSPLAALDYTAAPTLANPAGTAVVSVSTASALQTAITNLQSNQVIELADGTYTLTQSLFVNYGGATTLTNVGIRSASRNPTACVIQGAGMSGAIPHGIHVSKVNGMLIADLTIRLVANHAIQLAGESGVTNVRMYNLRLYDTGEQFIKGTTSGYGAGSDNGIVEYCLLSYTTQGTTYTNGVDVHGGDGWIIRHNRFERVNVIPGGIGPAVLMWNGSSNTLCEGNTFINCETAIAYGLIDLTAPQADHSGGIIRNNFIWRASGTPTGVDTPDCSILVWDSPNTKVLHNTVLQNGSYANAIEYRFSTTGAEFRYNLSDAAVTDRGGGTSGNTAGGNVTSAVSGWFVSASTGNLRLSAAAPASVVDAASTHADATTDYDGSVRGSSPDIGAHEYNATPSAPATPTGCTATALSGLQVLVSWNDASSNEDGFRIERSTGGAFSTAGTVAAGVESYTDSGLTEGQLYTYRVVSHNTVGDSSASNTAGATAVTTAPVGSSSTGGGGGGGCSTGGAAASWVLALLGLWLAARRVSFETPV
ncbi:MAG: fibronectin type III domain-containing protein [Planctomycetes bacterium]|nr:fibronectin type III domain-containing protein [Planctomycetota bacterium]